MTIPAYPRLRSEWELLRLVDDSLVFHSTRGRYFRIASPTPQVWRLVAMLDGARSLDEIQAAFDEREREGALALLAKLVAAEIVHDLPQRPRPAWLTDELQARFQLEIDYFQMISSERDEYETFRKLRDAHVMVIGVGGNGSQAAMALAAAGIGQLTLVDGDRVEESNLVRQIFYDAADVGRDPKAEVLRRRIEAFTPFTRVAAIASFIEGPEHARRLLDEARPDFVLVCADAPRILLNRWLNTACVRARIPYLNAFAGLVGPMYTPGTSPCFACFEAVSSAFAGDHWEPIVAALQHQRTRQYPAMVIGPLITGTIQARECLAFLTGVMPVKSLHAALRIDGTGLVETVPFAVRPDCLVCAGIEAA